MGVSSQYIASSSSIADGAVSEAKLAAEACSAAKMKKEGTAGEVLTSNGAGAIPSYQATGVASAGGGSPLYIPIRQAGAVIQGTWSWDYYASHWCANRFYNNAAAAVNDQIDFYVYLAAGTYSFIFFCKNDTAAGKVHILIDTIDKGNVDLYAGSQLENQVETLADVVVGTAGVKTISLKVSDKNASSSNYECDLNGFAIVRTA